MPVTPQFRQEVSAAFPAATDGSLVGRTLGSYEVKGLLGCGGMGEVYRARDSKLKRDVAIKALPADFVRDPERVARFQREAEVLASLNHPHIGAIYDLVQVGDSRFLVLELVEGKTLADRIGRGPIPVDDALSISKQIAEGLEAAHEKGIIHRDLKPSNIKITPNGTVKILDFGLAKVRATESADLSAALTKETLSRAGIIMGTAAYMSPEQAKGRASTEGSDVWGVRMRALRNAHRRTAFEGETVGEILARVSKPIPNGAACLSKTPEGIRRLLRRCLQKNANPGFATAAMCASKSRRHRSASQADTAGALHDSVGRR